MVVASLQSCPGPFPPQIQQMLLVLQSVHRSPPDSRFFVLQDLASRVVDNYLPMVTRSFSKGKSDGFLPMSLEGKDGFGSVVVAFQDNLTKHFRL